MNSQSCVLFFLRTLTAGIVVLVVLGIFQIIAVLGDPFYHLWLWVGDKFRQFRNRWK